MKKRNYKRLPTTEIINIEQALSSLPHPLRVEREGKGPVRIFDEEGNEIKILSYSQLPSLLTFIKKNCPHQ
jgi:hypothetical protein